MPLIAKNIIVGGNILKKEEPASIVEPRRPSVSLKDLREQGTAKSSPTRNEKFVGAKNVEVNKEKFFYKDSPYIRELIDN